MGGNFDECIVSSGAGCKKEDRLGADERCTMGCHDMRGEKFLEGKAYMLAERQGPLHAVENGRRKSRTLAGGSGENKTT
jgi:hypothetical protein